jgi:hypothetical protein
MPKQLGGAACFGDTRRGRAVDALIEHQHRFFRFSHQARIARHCYYIINTATLSEHRHTMNGAQQVLSRRDFEMTSSCMYVSTLAQRSVRGRGLHVGVGLHDGLALCTKFGSSAAWLSLANRAWSLFATYGYIAVSALALASETELRVWAGSGLDTVGGGGAAGYTWPNPIARVHERTFINRA